MSLSSFRGENRQKGEVYHIGKATEMGSRCEIVISQIMGGRGEKWAISGSYLEMSSGVLDLTQVVHNPTFCLLMVFLGSSYLCYPNSHRFRYRFNETNTR